MKLVIVKEIYQKILEFFNVTLPTSVTLTNPELYDDLYRSLK